MTSRHAALVGSTASGKSVAALRAAEAIGNVEIVSVDSMQVYRRMDIGTAKPTADERRRVPHHLIDVAEPWEEWSVVRFRDAVRVAVADIEARGRRALLVGGTGLYLRAVIDPLEFPGHDPGTRGEIDSGPTSELYTTLQSSDPAAAARIEPTNRRRIVRALEVVRLTGRRFSSFGPGLEHYGEPVFPITLVGLRVPRPLLRERIAARLAGMREDGFVDEVARLLSLPRPLSRTARQAIGYAEVAEHLEGPLSEDEAFAEAERRTWRFARRQIKWFERDPRIRWVDADNATDGVTRFLECWAACRTFA